jgi:C4-dicarboxylate transporter
VGYDTAIKFTDKISRTIWSVYGGLLATNGFLVSLAAFITSNVTFKVIPVKVLGVLGLILCITWFLITMRNFDYSRYYFAWAKKFETDAFGDTIEIVCGGATFAKGETVSIGSSIERMRWGSRLFKVEWLIYVVIGIFTIIYGYLIFGFIN